MWFRTKLSFTEGVLLFSLYNLMIDVFGSLLCNRGFCSWLMYEGVIVRLRPDSVGGLKW